ncbi:hypothetical protein CK203_072830 [Vitis vinifera]|uniref:Uncharacterized protein n=1 Tax=Vitis vinifera TaxID=29760 RepID=A0A438DM88_VITVI|nr:hypothetical protein CK203_072830 [Vitis vinifera]
MSSGSQSRSRSPQDRKIRTDRLSYRNAPYRRDSRRGFSSEVVLLTVMQSSTR